MDKSFLDGKTKQILEVDGRRELAGKRNGEVSRPGKILCREKRGQRRKISGSGEAISRMFQRPGIRGGPEGLWANLAETPNRERSGSWIQSVHFLQPGSIPIARIRITTHLQSLWPKMCPAYQMSKCVKTPNTTTVTAAAAVANTLLWIE